MVEIGSVFEFKELVRNNNKLLRSINKSFIILTELHQYTEEAMNRSSAINLFKDVANLGLNFHLAMAHVRVSHKKGEALEGDKGEKIYPLPGIKNGYEVKNTDSAKK